MYYLILFTVFDSIRLSWPNSFSNSNLFEKSKPGRFWGQIYRENRDRFVRHWTSLGSTNFQFFFVVFVGFCLDWIAMAMVGLQPQPYPCGPGTEACTVVLRPSNTRFVAWKTVQENYTASKHNCVCEGTLVCMPQALLVSDICDREGNSFWEKW